MTKMKYCPYCREELTLKRIEGRDYQGCPREGCDYVFWDNPLPVVAAIVEHDGKVLLARNKLWTKKMYGLITGFLEKGESPEGAVLREVKEELGLDGKLVEMVGLYSFKERNQLIIAYHVATAGEIAMSEELAEVISVPPEQLRPWSFGTGYAVKDWLKKKGIESRQEG